MKIKILSKQIDLTPAIKEYIEMKMGGLEKFVARYEAKGEVLVYFELARTTHHHHKGEVYYVESYLHLPGKDLRAEYVHEDARAAVDKVKDILKNEIVKYKEKSLTSNR